MGIRTVLLGFFHECMFLTHPMLDMSGKEMCELGDQTLILEGHSPSAKRCLAKLYFENLGFKHISIDIHGKNGTYPIDLCEPITDKYWLGKFDILTNFGTVEHVENQYECWRNIHNLVKVGGIFIHFLPVNQWESKMSPRGKPIGSPRIHCKYFYLPEFTYRLCKSNDYHPFASQPLLGGFGYCFKKVNDNEFQPTKEEIDSWIETI